MKILTELFLGIRLVLASILIETPIYYELLKTKQTRRFSKLVSFLTAIITG